MPYKIVSLFSGCGGLDKGFELTDSFEIVWANDLYLPSCKIFSKNFNLQLSEDSVAKPYFMCFRDIDDIDFTEFAESQDIDLIIGGPPCQDFSQIRGSEKRKGIKAKRGQLYAHFIRVLALLQPKLFVFENVKGLKSVNNGKAFKLILEDFQNLNLRFRDIINDHGAGIKKLKEKNMLNNYEILFSSVVDFSKLGVPQARERLIIIGLRKDIAGKNLVRDYEDELSNKLIPEKDALEAFPLTPIEVFTGKVLTELSDEYKKIMLDYKYIFSKFNSIRKKEYVQTVWNKYSLDIWSDYLFSNNLPTFINDKVKHEVNRRHKEILKESGYYKKPLLTSSFKDGSNNLLIEKENIIKRMNYIPPGENHNFVKGTEYQVTGLMSNIYKRVHPLKPSPTVIARGGGGTWGYHYKYDRQRLTNRERARLQTFPDDFEFFGGPGEIRRAIGEAVPPLASKKIAEIVLEILRN